MTLLLSLGCSGNIGQPSPETLRAPTVEAAPRPAPSDPRAPAPTPTPAPPLEDPFTLSRTSIQLLPYSVRLSKVAAVLGLPSSHPLLAHLRDAHVALGDHDYAHGIPADRSWSAAKLTAWVAAVRPVCASSELAARYPTLPERPDALIEAAYGRAADEDDRQELAAALAQAVAPTQAAEREAVCLAVLSSLEMVAQ